MAFGPESTNPRELRAYAHAKLAKARATGSNEDLAQAEEAVKKAGNSRKSRESNFGGALIGAALADYNTRTIVRISKQVLDPQLTPRRAIAESSDDHYDARAERFTPGYFLGNSRLLPLSMGRTERIDTDTGELLEASELSIRGYGVSRELIIPTDKFGRLDILAIGRIPDRKRFDIARLAGTIVALDPRPEIDLPTEEDTLEVVGGSIPVNA